jgi:hypothetical protein
MSQNDAHIDLGCINIPSSVETILTMPSILYFLRAQAGIVIRPLFPTTISVAIFYSTKVLGNYLLNSLIAFLE